MRQRPKGEATIRRAVLALGCWAAVCLGSNVTHAQEAPPSVLIDVGDCVSLKSPDSRLACFERHVAAAQSERGALPDPATSDAHAPAIVTQSPVAATAAVPAPAAVASNTVGATSIVGSSRPPTEAEPVAKSASAPPEIVATVTELHETVPNAWLITLDNGQVWRQNIPQRFALEAGQRVTLHGTKWGASYRLTADTLGGFIQVERVR
jgi:hypothetical protein